MHVDTKIGIQLQKAEAEGQRLSEFNSLHILVPLQSTEDVHRSPLTPLPFRMEPFALEVEEEVEDEREADLGTLQFPASTGSWLPFLMKVQEAQRLAPSISTQLSPPLQVEDEVHMDSESEFKHVQREEVAKHNFFLTESTQRRLP